MRKKCKRKPKGKKTLKVAFSSLRTKRTSGEIEMAVPPHVTHFQHPNQTRNLNRDQQLVYPGINVNANDGISNQNAYANKNKWIAEIPLYLVLGPAY